MYQSEASTSTTSIALFLSQSGTVTLSCSYTINGVRTSKNLDQNPPYSANTLYTLSGFITSQQLNNFTCGQGTVYSIPITAYTKPPAIVDMKIQGNPTLSSVTLGWNFNFAPSANQRYVTLFQLCATSIIGEVVCVNTTSATQKTASLDALPLGRTFTIVVKSWNGAIYSDASNVIAHSSVPTPAPSSLKVQVTNVVT